MHVFVVFDLCGYPFSLTTCDSGRFRPFVSERVNDFAVFSRRRYPFSLTICDLGEFRSSVSKWGYDFVVFSRRGYPFSLTTTDSAGFGQVVSEWGCIGLRIIIIEPFGHILRFARHVKQERRHMDCAKTLHAAVFRHVPPPIIVFVRKLLVQGTDIATVAVAGAIQS